MSNSINKLFVYGSLGPGRPNEKILTTIGGSWLKASVKGILFEEGWGAAMGFPGIRLTNDGVKIEGFLFVSDQLGTHWSVLDSFEGADYQRVQVTVELEDGSKEEAFIYVLKEGNQKVPKKIIPPPENILYDDGEVQVILAFDPISIGHVVIVPVRDYKDLDELPVPALTRIMELAQAYVKVLKEIFHPPGYSIMQNGGAFNDTGQFHLHVFPRFDEATFSWTYTDEVPNEATQYRTLQNKLVPALKTVLLSKNH